MLKIRTLTRKQHSSGTVIYQRCWFYSRESSNIIILLYYHFCQYFWKSVFPNGHHNSAVWKTIQLVNFKKIIQCIITFLLFQCGKLQVMAALVSCLAAVRSFQQNDTLDDQINKIILSEGFSNITGNIK